MVAAMGCAWWFGARGAEHAFLDRPWWAAGMYVGPGVLTFALTRLRTSVRLGIVTAVLVLLVATSVTAWLPKENVLPGDPVSVSLVASPDDADIYNTSRTPVLLVRIEQPAPGAATMQLHLLPVTALTLRDATGPAEDDGVLPRPSVVTSVALRDRLEISVTVRRYFDPLWWFPPFGVIVGARFAPGAVARATRDDDREIGVEFVPRRTRLPTAPTRVMRRLSELLSRDVSFSVIWPGAAGRFVQPGLYEVIIVTDTHGI
jgi:hypothetical protein